MGEPNAILRGGSGPLQAESERIHHVADPGAVLKLLNGNRYDHFEPTSETAEHGGRVLPILTWVRCTYVAE
jgi:hypothetical protein